MNSIYDEIHALDQTIKFLNEEAGHSHMGYYHTEQGWAGQQLIKARERLHELSSRRPIESGWIKLSERRPIEADADENGFVLARFSDSKEPSFRTWFALKHWQRAVAFMPIPKFTEEKDADEEAFEKWVTPLDIEMNSRDDPFYKRCAKRGWDAALEYAKSKE